VVGTPVQGTLSGIGGRFTVHSVPAGSVTLRAQTIGYAEDGHGVHGARARGGTGHRRWTRRRWRSTAIEVTAGRSGQREPCAGHAAQRGGHHERHLAEQISRSPDSDAGAAVQRVSGVTVQDGKFVFVRGLGERYTTTSLNGSRIPSPEPERKMVPLDLFPAGLLQQITTRRHSRRTCRATSAARRWTSARASIRARRQLTFRCRRAFNSAVTGRTLPMAPRLAASGFGGRDGSAADCRTVVRGDAAAAARPADERHGQRHAQRVVGRGAAGLPSTSLGLSLGGSDAFLGRDIGYLVVGHVLDWR
jgi:hypothetical protein